MVIGNLLFAVNPRCLTYGINIELDSMRPTNIGSHPKPTQNHGSHIAQRVVNMMLDIWSK